MNAPKVTALFFDVGGVLGTNGWDSGMRERAAKEFNLDLKELNSRHGLTFDTYEEGKLSLDEYLARVVFYKPQPFSKETFRDFMFKQSQPFPEMIQMARNLKARYGVKIAVLSNEGRELMLHRIKFFKLFEFVDFFIVSCFVHFRKPDADIYRVALDIAQVPADQVAYIEDREMFVDIGQSLGLRALRHVNVETTRRSLEAMIQS